MVRAHFISDHHLYHGNILKYCNRPFATIEEMHEHTIQQWNEEVPPDGIVVHLGDYICGGTFEQVQTITKQLNGFKILVTGNHDRKGKQWFLKAGFDRVFKYKWTIGMYCFSHRRMSVDWLIDNDVQYNLHGHCHKFQYGDPYWNFGVDIIGYKPKEVELNLSKEDLFYGESR